MFYPQWNVTVFNSDYIILAHMLRYMLFSRFVYAHSMKRNVYVDVG